MDYFLLESDYFTYEPVAKIKHNEAEEYTSACVDDEREETAIFNQQIIFVDEGREGSESSAEAYCQEEFQISVGETLLFEQSVKQTDSKASQDINDECTKREGGKSELLHPT